MHTGHATDNLTIKGFILDIKMVVSDAILFSKRARPESSTDR